MVCLQGCLTLRQVFNFLVSYVSFLFMNDSTLNHLGNPRRRTPSEELTRPYHFVYLHVRSLGVDKFNDDFSQFLRLAKMNTWFGFVIIWIFHLLSTEQRHLLCSLCVNKQTNFDSPTFADFTGKKKQKNGDWYIYPKHWENKIFNNAHKNVQKSSETFKLNLHNVVNTGTNITKISFWAV